jgi:tetratricopeptide (TPR) repeat protein
LWKNYFKKKENDYLEKAIEKFEDALYLSPNDTNLMATLGNLYLKKKIKIELLIILLDALKMKKNILKV